MSAGFTADSRKYGFIGAGNMNQAVIKALVEAKRVAPERIYVTNRTAGKLKKLQEQLNVHTLNTNEELVDECDVIFIGVKPQDYSAALEPIASSFQPSHVVISFAAGIALSSLKKMLPQVKTLVRVMPNTPAKIRQGVFGYSISSATPDVDRFVQNLFETMGIVVPAEEGEEFQALTVACSSGIGFVFEIMQYWQEWLEEHGFAPETAKNMVIQTFLGAVRLADESPSVSLEELQNQVTSKKGVTAAGLASLRELELDRVLRYSFEKAVLRDRELGKTSI